MKIEKLSLPFLGFLQTTGLVLYIFLVSLLMANINKIFVGMDRSSVPFLGPLAFLLLLVTSATISGLIVLGRAGVLFWEKKYQEAFTLAGWTILWAVLYLIAIFTIIYLNTPKVVLIQR